MSRFRNKPPAFVTMSVRLVSETRPTDPLPSDGHRFERRLLRPLFAGIAILHRDGRAGAAWTIDVSEDGRLLPHAPQSPEDLHRIVGLHLALGRQCRVGAALATPADLTAGPSCKQRPAARPESACRRRPEIYGWSLMYQLPSMRGTAAIDTHDRFEDLPAFFESPLELIDRSIFLAARGIPNRPIAVLTRPEDFVRYETGGRWGNRYYPQARFRRPCRLEAVL